MIAGTQWSVASGVTSYIYIRFTGSNQKPDGVKVTEI